MEEMKNEFISGNSIPDYITEIAVAITHEHQSVAEYDRILSESELPLDVRNTLIQIRDDEKDHVVDLSNLLSIFTKYELPDNREKIEYLKSTDNTSMKIYNSVSSDGFIDDTTPDVYDTALSDLENTNMNRALNDPDYVDDSVLDPNYEAKYLFSNGISTVENKDKSAVSPSSSKTIKK